jgi:hypothetical protein
MLERDQSDEQTIRLLVRFCFHAASMPMAIISILLCIFCNEGASDGIQRLLRILFAITVDPGTKVDKLESFDDVGTFKDICIVRTDVAEYPRFVGACLDLLTRTPSITLDAAVYPSGIGRRLLICRRLNG